MSMLLGLAVVAILGDFDRDGRSDRAYLRTSSHMSELIVERAAGKIVVIDGVKDAEEFYFKKIQPGKYRAACSKGLGRSKPCAAPVITVKGDALQFGTREVSRQSPSGRRAASKSIGFLIEGACRNVCSGSKTDTRLVSPSGGKQTYTLCTPVHWSLST
jgi:hypothetical protein